MPLYGLLLVALLVAEAVAGATLRRLPPFRLSLGGGTTVAIDGWGFSKNQFNHFNATLGNRVVFENKDEAIECPVLSFLTTSTRIVCSAGKPLRATSNTEYKVRVYVDGVQASGELTALYVRGMTPVVQKVVPSWGFPGQRVLLVGSFKTGSITDPAHPEASQALAGPLLSRAYLGGNECQLYNSTSGQVLGQLRQDQVTCTVPGSAIGSTNASVYVSEMGASATFARDLFVDAQDELYVFHVAPGVSSVSPSAGSSTGGSLLTIRGVGFLPHRNATSVRVGGAECTITNVSATTVTCIAPPRSLTTPAQGERGLLLELWEGQFAPDLSDRRRLSALTPQTDGYSSSVVTDLHFQIDAKKSFVAKLTGYFHAPHDGSFTLAAYVPTRYGTTWLACLAADGDPDKAVPLPKWGSVELRADTPAYLEVVISGRRAGVRPTKVLMTDHKRQGQRADTWPRKSGRASPGPG
ncbi:fibrocystin-L-like [Penaeus monodon]|uniref:fibrocystin-L-like n=1 Tax=Penaeus monodon TaxID=6687 RepID=UPI0018A7D0E2|nr:fibrocystin-L-like [Penaeus monodon]